MSIITLLTDFGIKDEFVASLKGVILSINKDVKIVDISHHIEPQNIIEAAYMIKAVYKYFPKGTIHVIVVDPGVGTARDIIVVESEDYIFIAPNNGILGLVINEIKINSIIKDFNKKFLLKSISQTFHGRDIFAPVAAHISKGIKIEEIGDFVSINNLEKINFSLPFISSKMELIGTIIAIDRFGNLITNISFNSLKIFLKNNIHTNVEIIIANKRIIGLSSSYIENNRKKNQLAIIGSRNYLEISVSCGNAKEFFKEKEGYPIRIKKTGVLHK